ncbi:MAG: FecR domain-containing protein [Balneolales bacterium]
MSDQKFSISELIKSESFNRWVYGRTDAQENEYWDQWLKKSEENRSRALKAQQYLTRFSINPSSRPDAAKSWKKIENSIGGYSITNRKLPSEAHYTYDFIMRMAATLLVVILLGVAALDVNVEAEQNQETLVQNFVEKEVATTYGERKIVNLSDGSVITLNADSELTYRVNESEPSDVNLQLNGEAYFSVTSRTDTEYSFNVNTTAGSVRVMGTSFVVSTRKGHTEVALEEGSVAINITNRSNDIFIEPGQLAVFNTDSDQVDIQEVNLDVYTSWTTHMLVFDQTPLDQVIHRLEHTFGVKAEVQNNEYYERRISGSIENTSLEVIVSALSQTMDIDIQLEGDAIYFD